MRVGFLNTHIPTSIYYLILKRMALGSDKAYNICDPKQQTNLIPRNSFLVLIPFEHFYFLCIL